MCDHTSGIKSNKLSIFSVGALALRQTLHLRGLKSDWRATSRMCFSFTSISEVRSWGQRSKPPCTVIDSAQAYMSRQRISLKADFSVTQDPRRHGLLNVLHQEEKCTTLSDTIVKEWHHIRKYSFVRGKEQVQVLACSSILKKKLLRTWVMSSYVWVSYSTSNYRFWGRGWTFTLTGL